MTVGTVRECIPGNRREAGSAAHARQISGRRFTQNGRSMVRIEDLDSLEKALTAGLSANRAELERLELDAEWAKGRALLPRRW